jgi:tetratricopeptide (TPR) repeat protein
MVARLASILLVVTAACASARSTGPTPVTSPAPVQPKPAPATADKQRLLEACRTSYKDRRYEEAHSACLAARDAAPTWAVTHQLLAEVYFRFGLFGVATAEAEEAIRLDPKCADAYVLVGATSEIAGNKDAARRAYQRYLELSPDGFYAEDLRAILSRL